MGAFVAIVVFGAIVVAIVLLQSHHEKKSREAWQAHAEMMGFRFEPLGRLQHDFRAFKLFSQGRDRKSKNLSSGIFQGVPLIFGEYAYTTGGGKSRHRHAQTVFIFQNPEFALPHCFLRRESRVFDFLGKLFGGQDINYDEDPDFSKAFVLQGANEQATRMAFDEEVRRGFLSQRGHDLQFEAYGQTLVVHWGLVIAPENINHALQRAYDLMSLFAQRQH